MKKSLLKEVIKNIVAKKLAESNGQKTGTYGYILADKDTDDPTLQMVGYGNMPKSRWKKKILDDLEKLKEEIEAENWRNATHLVEKNGVLYSALNMMKEIFAQDLNEADEIEGDTAGGMTQDAARDGTDQQASKADPTLAIKQKQLAAEKASLDDLSNAVKKAESNIARREETVKKANQKDQLAKDKATRKQAPIISKINALQKDIEKKTGKQSGS